MRDGTGQDLTSRNEGGHKNIQWEEIRIERGWVPGCDHLIFGSLSILLAFVYKYCPWLFPCSCSLTSISGPRWLRPLPIRIPFHCVFLWPPTSQQVKSQGWMSKKSHFFEIHVFFKFKDASKWRKFFRIPSWWAGIFE
jgi:hypothetical protein